MLAQNFKTAADLQIREEYHAAFIKLLGMLERGELIHVKRCYGKPIKNGFNMASVWSDHDGCSSVGCILGWANVIACGGPNQRYSISQSAEGSRALDRLFMPHYYEDGEHTVEEAAHALRTYLVTGEADWS